ncbi:MAG: hypothetical protein O2816_09895 [Planctomycetota bacterium]|nr:hypothetical protein [Planctomycetota bacterium]
MDERPYLLLTPGPLTTTPTVKRAMLTDLSTWDRDYADNVQSVRARAVGGFEDPGVRPLLPAHARSPTITSSQLPETIAFAELYLALEQRGFVIYPGKVPEAETCRLGHIGDPFPADVDRLMGAFAEALTELRA